jgi:hypothetical protein
MSVLVISIELGTNLSFLQIVHMEEFIKLNRCCVARGFLGRWLGQRDDDPFNDIGEDEDDASNL